MILSKDLIFVHIPKTAGKSIIQAFREKNKITGDIHSTNLITGEKIKNSHFTAAQVRAVVGSEIYDQAFKFSIVRDPVDRIISYYSYGMGHFENKPFENYADFFLWIIGEKEIKNIGPDWENALKMQVDFINDKIDLLIHFDNLPAGFEVLKSKGFLSGNMPHVNKSAVLTQYVRKMMQGINKDLIDKLIRHYAADFEFIRTLQ